MNSKHLKIDKSWTLFLDRDGVINQRLTADYVKNWEEFVFLPDVLDAIAGFSGVFNNIFVVTNQQGIGKNIMNIEDFQFITEKMISKISETGGKIDKVYFCPHLKEDNCECRKPKIGMLLNAKKDFPNIEHEKSIMIGDTESDIKMAKNANMISILINEDLENQFDADFCFTSLMDCYIFLSLNFIKPLENER